MDANKAAQQSLYNSYLSMVKRSDKKDFATQLRMDPEQIGSYSDEYLAEMLSGIKVDSFN